MQDKYGHTRKVGFKKGNKHSPHGQRRFPEAADDSAASAALPTTAARDLLSEFLSASSSSSAMLIDDATVSSTPSASSSGIAMQIAAPSDTRDLGSASSAASAMQISAPSDTRDLGSASSAASAADRLLRQQSRSLEPYRRLPRTNLSDSSSSSSSASVRCFFLFYSRTSRPALTSPYASSHRWTTMTTILT
jgi:hypothetical protein